MDSPRLKLILRFPFFRKVRVTLRYPKDYKGEPVYAQFINLRTRQITIVRTNNKTEEAKEAILTSRQNTIGLILDSGLDTNKEEWSLGNK